MSEINYDDKADLIVDTTIDNIFKVTASDMNEIKSVVNGNADEVGDITTLTTTNKTSVVNAINEINKPENWVSVGTTAPTDGRRVWFKKGKNLLKLNIIITPTTYSGVTFTPNNDGTITLNGTATGNRWVELSNMIISSTSFNLGAVTNTTKSLTNNNYTLSAKLTNGQANVSFNSTNNMTSCYLYANTTYNNAILQIQFEKGSIATTYEPYIEKSIKVDDEDFVSMSDLVSVGANQPSDGKRVWFKKGKNLLPTNKYIATRTTNGITFTNNGDGTFNVSGTASANTTMAILPENNFQLEQGQAYYLYSSVPYNATTFNLSISMTENGTGRYCLANNTYTPTAQPIQERVAFYVPSGTSVNATNVKLMLVKGNTAPSEYEPYVEQGIYVDNELFYDKSLIKSINFGSITTSASGYYDLGLMCNEVAIIGIKHNAIDSGTKIEIYSNQLGHLFIRCSVNGEYSAKTINNVIVYCI